MLKDGVYSIKRKGERFSYWVEFKKGIVVNTSDEYKQTIGFTEEELKKKYKSIKFWLVDY